MSNQNEWTHARLPKCSWTVLLCGLLSICRFKCVWCCTFWFECAHYTCTWYNKHSFHCWVLKFFLDWKVISIISLQVKIWMTIIFLHQMQRSTDLHLREIMALSKMNDIALRHMQKHLNRVALPGSNSNSCSSSSSRHPIENQSERNLHLRRTIG